MAALPQQGAAPLAPLTRLSLHTHKNSIPAFGVCTIFAGFHFIREVIPIAIYHCNISIVSRGKGKSAVAAAAYRSGEKLTNEWDGMTHDYTRKGGVVHTEIMLPPHAPPSFSDRSTLWNSVELYEKAGNAQLAREIDAALPIELSREEQIRLVREYCSSQFVSRGMCVDYAIHDTGKGNPHCHIMLKQSVHLLDDLPLEKGIVGVIKKVKKLGEKELVGASLDPKEIKQKLSPTQDMALYIAVNGYVTTYYPRIREIMMNLDKRGEIDYDEIQDQIHAFYKRLKKANKSRLEIFNEIAGKIHRVTLQDDIYCQIVVSYFVQSCEVFDAITE